MENSRSQAIFCSSLNYFSEGNYSTFKKICSLAFPIYADIRYFSSNLFLAANVAGLIDARHYGPEFRWCSAIRHYPDHCVHIGCKPSKIIGTTLTWFEDYNHCHVPLISDQNDVCLISGIIVKDTINSSTNNVFNENFLNSIPNLSAVEKIVCVEENSPLHFPNKIEFFDIIKKKWNQITINNITESSLIRVYKEFAGIHYYIVNPNLDVYFKIQWPEWAFIIFANQFNWKLNNFIHYNNHTLTIDRRFQLPILLLRFLFISSDSLKVGNNLEFTNIDKNSAETFLTYLNKPCG